MSRPFVSYDGPDKEGFRAEVWVEKGVGVITSIEEKAQTAAVKIRTPKLTHPNIGNIRIDDPLYQEVLKYKDSGQEIPWRIESQRKPSVDRKTPIRELRTSTEVAKENTVRILASLGENFSQEALTNPAEDPDDSGRISALNTPVSKPQADVPAATASSADYLLKQLASLLSSGGSNYLVSAVVNQLISLGADLSDVDKTLSETRYNQGRDVSTISANFRAQNSFAKEEARWKEFNSDNYVNIGSSIMQAVIGAEGATKDELFRSGILSEEELNSSDPQSQSIVRYAISLVLELSDYTQTRLYELQDVSGGARFRPDRALDSHTRARGLVYDTIRKYAPFPAEKNNDLWLAWKDETKAILENRVRVILSAAYPSLRLTPPANSENASEENGSHESGEVAGDANHVEQATTTPESEVNTEEFLPPRNPNVVNEDNPQATEDGVELLRSLALSANLSSKEDLLAVGALLDYLFGVSIAKELSESNLNDFVDFYAVDDELLRKAVNWIKANPRKGGRSGN